MFSAVVLAARECVERSRYCFEPQPGFAPAVVNCYTLVTWVFNECYGIILDNCLEKLLYAGDPVAEQTHIEDGDLVFTAGRYRNFVRDTDRARQGVGHVVICTATGTGIHACSSAQTVVEAPLEKIFLTYASRGIYRIPSAHRLSS